MVIMRLPGIISFCLVGSMWLISSLLHRPVFGNGEIKSGKNLDDKGEALDEKQAAITAATWTVLNPPS
jgi:hypothetical protein